MKTVAINQFLKLINRKIDFNENIFDVFCGFHDKP